jgi:hypothetical protein
MNNTSKISPLGLLLGWYLSVPFSDSAVVARVIPVATTMPVHVTDTESFLHLLSAHLLMLFPNSTVIWESNTSQCCNREHLNRFTPSPDSLRQF